MVIDNWEEVEELFNVWLEKKDEQSFESFILKITTWGISLIFNITRNLEDAKDVWQEVVNKLWDKSDSFKGNSSLKTWLSRIVINETINFIRKQKSYYKKKQSQLKKESEKIRNENLFNEVRYKILQEKLRQVILTLPDDLKQVAILLFVENFSYDEIAQILKISKTNVRVRVFKIRKILREKLKPYLE